MGEMRRFLAAGLSAAVIAFYALMVGGEPSVVRAAIMGVLSLFAVQLGRRQGGLNSLALATVAWQLALHAPDRRQHVKLLDVGSGALDPDAGRAVLLLEWHNFRLIHAPKVLAALQGYNLLRTDKNGWIELTTDGERLWVGVERR
jgi:beta-lactamase superfamily II metal-dependent hydrolase